VDTTGMNPASHASGERLSNKPLQRTVACGARR